jgi:hypothetical protein
MALLIWLLIKRLQKNRSNGIGAVFFWDYLSQFLGTVITLFFKDENKNNRTISSLFGLSVAAGVVLIVAAISAANYY